jgi:hypothetical protein
MYTGIVVYTGLVPSADAIVPSTLLAAQLTPPHHFLFTVTAASKEINMHCSCNVENSTYALRRSRNIETGVGLQVITAEPTEKCCNKRAANLLCTVHYFCCCFILLRVYEFTHSKLQTRQFRPGYLSLRFLLFADGCSGSNKRKADTGKEWSKLLVIQSYWCGYQLEGKYVIQLCWAE